MNKWALICGWLFGLGATALATDYYLDAVEGSDTNNGTSSSSAWQTLSEVNSRDFSPGDRILFKRGQTFSGMLDLRNETGAAGSPIVAGSYGNDAGGAVLDGTGQTASVHLGSAEYIEIENLELTGKGILATAFSWQSPGKVWDHYHFRNLYIHDTANTAINMYVSNLGGFTFKDISISNCVIETIGGAGITINKWAGEAVKTVDTISPADSARTPGTYTGVTADNLTRTQIIPAEFTVTVDGSGAASISVTDKGSGYKENDSLVIADADLGGGGAADLTFLVNAIQPADPNGFYHEDVVIRDNIITNVDAAGMQVGKIRNGLIEGNVVTNPGRDYDAAGSGLWTWFCGTPSTTFMVQHNSFTGSQGDTDSCGAHIDIGCVNNIYQYNLSRENQGGFMEILGKSSNCVYRYNISINDGIRESATNPYQADGRTLFLGGYTGRGGPQLGPYNNYIYNNTIYTRPEIVSKYSIAASATGALFANNIIYVSGSTEDVMPPGSGSGNGTDIIFDNNLVYQSKVPITPWNSYTNNRSADPQFVNVGGLNPEDYEPLNAAEVVDQGIHLYLVPGDSVGVAGGFAVLEDFFGNPITGLPDMGAIELPVLGNWVELVNDDFESGWGNWLSAGADAFLSSENAIGTKCVDLQDDTETSEIELVSALDLTGYTRLKIAFTYMPVSFEGAEDFFIQFSSDGGSNWLPVATFVNGVDFSNDTRENPVLTIDHSGFDFTDNVKIKFECDASGNSDDVYIDDIVISGFVPDTLPGPDSGYTAWSNTYALVEGMSGDDDSDGLSNLGEYAIGGNPTNGFVDGSLPIFEMNGGQMLYIHVRRTDDANLIYALESSTNLVSGIWTNSGYTVIGTNTSFGGNFEEVTNSIPMTDDQRFVRLVIEEMNQD